MTPKEVSPLIPNGRAQPLLLGVFSFDAVPASRRFFSLFLSLDDESFLFGPHPVL